MLGALNEHAVNETPLNGEMLEVLLYYAAVADVAVVGYGEGALSDQQEGEGVIVMSVPLTGNPDALDTSMANASPAVISVNGEMAATTSSSGEGVALIGMPLWVDGDALDTSLVAASIALIMVHPMVNPGHIPPIPSDYYPASDSMIVGRGNVLQPVSGAYPMSIDSGMDLFVPEGDES